MIGGTITGSGYAGLETYADQSSINNIVVNHVNIYDRITNEGTDQIDARYNHWGGGPPHTPYGKLVRAVDSMS